MSTRGGSANFPLRGKRHPPHNPGDECGEERKSTRGRPGQSESIWRQGPREQQTRHTGSPSRTSRTAPTPGHLNAGKEDQTDPSREEDQDQDHNSDDWDLSTDHESRGSPALQCQRRRPRESTWTPPWPRRSKETNSGILSLPCYTPPLGKEDDRHAAQVTPCHLRQVTQRALITHAAPPTSNSEVSDYAAKEALAAGHIDTLYGGPLLTCCI